MLVRACVCVARDRSISQATNPHRGPHPHCQSHRSSQVMNEAIKTDRVRLVVKDEATGASSQSIDTTRGVVGWGLYVCVCTWVGG